MFIIYPNYFFIFIGNRRGMGRGRLHGRWYAQRGRSIYIKKYYMK